jgi:hypothetical protein
MQALPPGITPEQAAFAVRHFTNVYVGMYSAPETIQLASGACCCGLYVVCVCAQ